MATNSFIENVIIDNEKVADSLIKFLKIKPSHIKNNKNKFVN